MRRQQGGGWINELRGSFAGVLYDKKEQEIVIFSDQIGSRFLYYTKVNDTFYVSSLMDDVYRFRGNHHAKSQLSVENSYLLLSYGYMVEDRTLCKEIKKVLPGHYLTIKNGKVREEEYFLLDNTPDTSPTEDEWIERIDETFRIAVQQQFEKDNEYGYKHLSALSAGLDSRMTSWVAHDMGYTSQLNYTFSQSDYWDQTIPQQITRDMKHEWIYESLDNGLWLYNLEDITRLTGGSVLYYGLSHAYSMYSKMNFEEFGIIHTGQLGDAILGTYCDTENEETFKWGDGAYSMTMLDKVKSLEIRKYKNQEMAVLYLRGFGGTNNGNMAEYVFTDSLSPFYNLEFFKLALSIPLRYRFDHRIYKKWIIRKYPAAAEYVWEKIGCKITRSFGIISIHGRTYRLETLPNKMIRRLFPTLSKPNVKSMNPLDDYVENNQELGCFLQSYRQYADKIGDEELRNDVVELSRSGNAVERIEAASLLAAIKLYF